MQQTSSIRFVPSFPYFSVLFCDVYIALTPAVIPREFLARGYFHFTAQMSHVTVIQQVTKLTSNHSTRRRQNNTSRVWTFLIVTCQHLCVRVDLLFMWHTTQIRKNKTVKFLEFFYSNGKKILFNKDKTLNSVQWYTCFNDLKALSCGFNPYRTSKTCWVSDWANNNMWSFATYSNIYPIY